MDRHGAFRRSAAHFSEHRRRHIFPLGYAGGGRRVAAGVNITYKLLYNSRGGDDGRTEAAGAMPSPAIYAQAGSRWRAQDLRAVGDSRNTEGVKLAANVDGARSRRSAGRAAGAGEDPGRQRDSLRSAMRGGEAAAAFARQAGGADASAGDQRRGLRRLRRLRDAIQLHESLSGGDGVRAEDAHSSIVLQQGLFLRAWRLSVVRHGQAQTGHGPAPAAAARVAGDGSEGSARACGDRRTLRNCSARELAEPAW